MADIKVRVGQQNAIKVVSSVSGAPGGAAVVAENVIGGIASVTQLNVSGVSTFIGVSTFKNDVYIDGDLYISDDLIFDEFTARNATITGNTVLGITSISQLYVAGISTLAADGGITTTGGDLYVGGDLYINDDLVFDEFNARNGNVSGILTVAQGFYYPLGEPFGIAYFDLNDQLVSTGTTAVAISETNYIVSTNSSGIPTWANVIDGGSY
jgi:cytoskeletal protein CcmA (bactofilin family)